MMRVTDAITKPQWKPEKKSKAVAVKIKQVGKVGKAWDTFRRQYLKDHPADWLSNYVCAIGGEPVHSSAVQLDHIQRRGSHPELRFDPANIQLVCAKHHQEKDSGFRF